MSASAQPTQLILSTVKNVASVPKIKYENCALADILSEKRDYNFMKTATFSIAMVDKVK